MPPPLPPPCLCSDLQPELGYIFITWDSITFSGSNRAEGLSRGANDGPNTLLHELFHHLGLWHTFGQISGGAATCYDDDYVSDTPSTLGQPLPPRA